MSSETDLDGVASRQKRASTKIQKKFKRRAKRKMLQLLVSTPYSGAFKLATERCASNWLTRLVLEKQGFFLSKASFRYALCLRYSWPLKNVPSHCVCGEAFSVQHCFSCPTGGIPAIRHNEVRDITAEKLTEVCSNVKDEPNLERYLATFWL